MMMMMMSIQPGQHLVIRNLEFRNSHGLFALRAWQAILIWEVPYGPYYIIIIITTTIK